MATCRLFDPESKGGTEATVKIAKADLVPAEANLAAGHCARHPQDVLHPARRARRAPRVAMQILRHSRISVTMEICTEATPEATREALRRLGQSLGGDDEGWAKA